MKIITVNFIKRAKNCTRDCISRQRCTKDTFIVCKRRELERNIDKDNK